MTKTLLKLTRCFINRRGTIRLDDSAEFTVMINPAEFKHDHVITYDSTKTAGQVGKDPKFMGMNPEKVGFSIVLDGTGAVMPASPGQAVPSVKTQLDKLLKVIYRYVGDQHEPGHVRLLWGTLIFFGRLESISTSYTLFKPSGDPLRAKVQLSFMGAMSNKEAELQSNRSSPDLSHLVEVRDGDTLPLLCERIYGDPSYYPDVARFNRLVDFRRLTPGGTLHFPPLA
ncbi:MAG TPA: peptidoglycan-binding protein [Rhizobacter sp.]|nr:peptidoglycan-binding protein [Rhizobacter sp.]